MKKNIYRQGDVLILPIKSNQIPKGLKQTKSVTLALGEVTGHHHTISRGAVGFGQSETALADYFQVTNDEAVLDHQEHKSIWLPKGSYRKIIQSEYTPEAIRPVAD